MRLGFDYALSRIRSLMDGDTDIHPRRTPSDVLDDRYGWPSIPARSGSPESHSWRGWKGWQMACWLWPSG